MLLSGYQIGQRTDIFIAAKKKKKILLDINALDQGLVNCSLWTKPNLKPVLVNKDLLGTVILTRIHLYTHFYTTTTDSSNDYRVQAQSLKYLILLFNKKICQPL